MGELTDLALATITQAQRSVEIVGQNMANAATPAFKRRVAFAQLVGLDNSRENALPQISVAIDNRPGKLVQTGNPSDLALSGAGVFALRRDSNVVYARNGQFTVNGTGRLVDGQGFALQLANGNDVVVKSTKFQIGVDGTVTENGESLGRIAVFAPLSDSSELDREAVAGVDRSQLVLLDNAQIKQGAYEASNVSTGDEMVAMIEALRRAESSQRLMNVYDELMGRVITTFGEGSR